MSKIKTRQEDFAKWYSDVVQVAELIQYGPTKGTVFFQPWSFAIWELIQKHLNNEFKKQNVQNVYFPLLMPESFLQKEKDHISGFAPEVFQVTRIGDKELEETLIIRPTSEVLFADYFKKTINAYRDLPVKLNQWCNVLRSEKNTKPFLRTSEFLWQEGHTCHIDSKDAKRTTRNMIKIYNKLLNNVLAIPVVMGEKTANERFAGAKNTYTVEALMQDGQALQCGTSHYLGQNFAKSFDIKYQNESNSFSLVHQTSWGVSTRLLGAIIMTHADDKGLVLPPNIAPIQVAILTILANKNPEVAKKAKLVKKLLGSTIRTEVDLTDKGFGYKASYYETKGVPIRIEIGPRDLEDNMVTVARRDKDEKIRLSIDSNLKLRIQQILKQIQTELYNKAIHNKDSKTKIAHTKEELIKHVNSKNWVIAPWCNSKSAEKDLKAETGITTRCILSNQDVKKYNLPELKTCFYTGQKATKWVLFARAY